VRHHRGECDLSGDEHRRVVAACVETAAGRVPVIAGCGSNNTAHAIELTRSAKAAGADAALHVPPYYNRPNQEGVYAHLAAVAEAVDLPIVLYNVPARTVTDIAVDTMARLARIANIVAVKDATGNLARVSAQRLACGPISFSSPAMTTWRWAFPPWVASAAFRSPPTSPRASVPTFRKRACPATGPELSSSRTAFIRSTPPCSPMPRQVRSNMP
jgi:hypothetical protein